MLALAKQVCGALVRPADEAPVEFENPWQRYWGETYGPELKEWLLRPVFEELEKAGKIGDLIVDVGSGAKPVTQLIQARAARKRIFVDIAADNSSSADNQKIRLDAGKVAEPGALSIRKAQLRVCRFLGIDPRAGGDIQRADTMVFSDLLNYVDFEEVLGGFARYLKPGGRIVVSNLPMRGNISLFSEKGLKDNRQLYRFLARHRFEIEHKSFPKRHPKETEEAEELIVLVARKRGDDSAVQGLQDEIVLGWSTPGTPIS
jgi:SAM-dependent methyltransferase